MSTVPEHLKYTKDHEWVQLDGKQALVGITDHAQAKLGDVVFVELPSIGQELEQFKELGVVESVKAASDVYSPLSGAVQAVNPDLEADPSLVNQDPYQKGWFVKLEVNPDSPEFKQLMDATAYKSMIAEDTAAQ